MLLHTHKLREYEITYTNAIYYLIARNDEAAAYSAAELTPDGEQLLNVRRSDEW